MVQKTRVELDATPREVLGKKVRALRRQGITPANVYGANVESVAIQLSDDEVKRILKEAGRHEVVYLSIGGSEARPTFVHDLQTHPITEHVLHIDFLQIDLKKKIKIDVPLHLEGLPPAVDTYQGILVQSLDHVTVESLPTDVPAFLEVDVSVLEEIDSALHVSDLKVPDGVEMVTDGELLVAKVAPPVVEAVEEPAAEVEEGEEVEEAEGEEEAAEEAGEEAGEEEGGEE